MRIINVLCPYPCFSWHCTECFIDIAMIFIFSSAYLYAVENRMIVDLNAHPGIVTLVNGSEVLIGSLLSYCFSTIPSQTKTTNSVNVYF